MSRALCRGAAARSGSAWGRWVRLGALCSLAIVSSGCLDYREVLTLNHEGGGRLEAELTLDMGLMRELSLALGEAPAADDLAGPTGDEVLRLFDVEGVTVEELRVEQDDARTRVRLQIDFDDLAALHRIEAFSARRRIELFDHGEGRVLLVSRFDPRGVIPLPGALSQRADGSPLGPHQAAVVEEVVQRIRRSVRLESELRLPGPILASNSHPDARRPGFDVGAWSFGGERNPVRQEDLGREVVQMQILCGRGAVPWAEELSPTPPGLDPVAEEGPR
jgi:hypothetical protein